MAKTTNKPASKKAAPKAAPKRVINRTPVRTKNTKLSKRKRKGEICIPDKYTPGAVREIVQVLLKAVEDHSDIVFITELFEYPEYRQWYRRFYDWKIQYPDDKVISRSIADIQFILKTRIKKGALNGKYHAGSAQFILRSDYGMRDGTEPQKNAPTPIAKEEEDATEAEIVDTPNLVESFNDHIKEITKAKVVDEQ